MKQLLVLLFIFQASFVFSAEAPGEDGVSAIEKIQTQFELGHKRKFKLMMQKICNNLIAATVTEKSQIGEKIESIILRYNNLTKDSPDYQKKFEAFWDINKNDFKCDGNPNYAGQHLLKVIVDMQMYRPVLNKYFLSKTTGYKLNMNAFEMVNDKPETIVDYLQGILDGDVNHRSYNTREIRRLLAIVKRKFDGKSGVELLIEDPQLLDVKN
jgi:hypothetical protein